SVSPRRGGLWLSSAMSPPGPPLDAPTQFGVVSPDSCIIVIPPGEGRLDASTARGRFGLATGEDIMMLRTHACALPVTAIVLLLPGSVGPRAQNPAPVAEAAPQATDDTG